MGIKSRSKQGVKGWNSNSLDTINLIPAIASYECEEEGTVEHFDLTCVINGEPINFFTDLAAFVLNNFNNLVTYEGGYTYSRFEPFTCSCGEGGCAGIWDGIYMKRRKHTVDWRVPGEEQGYKFMPKMFFRFDKDKYDAECLKLWKFINEHRHLKEGSTQEDTLGSLLDFWASSTRQSIIKEMEHIKSLEANEIS